MSTTMCSFCTKIFPVDEISLSAGVCELCEELLPMDCRKSNAEKDYE